MTKKDNDDEGNIQVAKRELIRRGVEKGFLTRKEIQVAMPLEYMSENEIEVLLFTLRTMDIKILEDP